ncbi:hypothetical protein FSARC_877 [Fusarium sarcochroum]|uniref:Uncharacterized protein n=1 Tax=Fusarium sarcochroum TaxID=1208366 RepID=A0A8H4XFW3_9HYPO|nr:hypothetical protein FSARC_877 [Fusarium sarcochroum]
MGNGSSKDSPIIPRLSQEIVDKGIPHKLTTSFAKRASLTLQCLLSEADSERAFAVHIPPNAYYDVILYDGPDATCPVLATAKGNPKWKQDFRINLPGLTEGDDDTREELLRCTTVNKLKEGYWFGMQLGDGLERFEWRLSRGKQVKSIDGSSWGWKLVRLGTGDEEPQEDINQEGRAEEEVVAVFGSDNSLGLNKIGVASAKSDQIETICDKQRFGELNDSLSYYPNAWNKKSPKNGFVCLKVDNSTPAFDATWNWDKNIQDVHSFPYVRFNHEDLPMRLSDLESIRLSTDWIYTPGSPSKLPRDFSSSVWASNKAKLESEGVQANAAWDFFLDDDRNRTLYPQVAAIEFMVWLGRVGDPWWLGRENNTILSNVTLGETEFSLFYGRNSGGTHVFTAVTRDNQDVLSLDEDFYPLFEYILEQAHKHIDTPNDLPKDPWLGIVEFGTETWLSDGNVTFTAANFGMSLKGNMTSSNRNSTKDKDDDNDNDKNDGDDDSNGENEAGNNSTDSSSKGDEEDDAVRLMSQSMLGYVVAAALVISAVLS